MAKRATQSSTSVPPPLPAKPPATTLPTNCPAGTTCKVTGGGYIYVDPQQDRGSFNIELTVDSSGRIHGKISFRDPAAALAFRTLRITSVRLDGNAATIKGTGTANGMETGFVVKVEDKAEPGVGQDTFSIQLETGYSKSGVLQGGNIQIH